MEIEMEKRNLKHKERPESKEDNLDDVAVKVPEIQNSQQLLEMQLISNKLKGSVSKNNVDFKSKKQADLYKKFMKSPPFFAKKDVVKTFARTQVPDQANYALKDARKRFEAELLRKRQIDIENDKEARDLERENERFELANQIRRKQEQQAFKDILTEQVEMGKMRKQLERDEIQEPTDVHYGPQEDNHVAHHYFERKMASQKMMNDELMS